MERSFFFVIKEDDEYNLVNNIFGLIFNRDYNFYPRFSHM